MQSNQCLISRQSRKLNSEMGREFAAAGSYKQSYPQKLGRVGLGINIGSVNTGIVDKLAIFYMDLFEMNAFAALKNFVTKCMTPAPCLISIPPTPGHEAIRFARRWTIWS